MRARGGPTGGAYREAMDAAPPHAAPRRPARSEPRAAGALCVIAGPMFAGKTDHLLRRIAEARQQGRAPVVVTHSFDTRYGHEELTTHDGGRTPAIAVSDVPGLLEAIAQGAAPLDDAETPGGPTGCEAQGHDAARLVVIDEAQFFGPALQGAVMDLLRGGADVMLAGLSVTYDGEPFTPIPQLMAVADEVVKLAARCTVCGLPAPFHRPRGSALGAPGPDAETGGADGSGPLHLTPAAVGGGERYEARCLLHFRGA